MNSKLILATGLTLLAFSGCTHKVKIDYDPQKFAAVTMSAKNPAVPAVVIGSDLTDFKHRKSMMGDTFDYQFGPPLAKYAQETTSAVFADTKRFSTEDEAANQGDAVLICRAKKAENALATVSWAKNRFSLIVEWELRDRSSQQLLWLTTIEGKAEYTAGNLFTGASTQRKLFQLLFEDLTQKTIQEFQNSPEIAAISP